MSTASNIGTSVARLYTHFLSRDFGYILAGVIACLPVFFFFDGLSATKDASFWLFLFAIILVYGVGFTCFHFLMFIELIKTVPGKRKDIVKCESDTIILRYKNITNLSEEASLGVERIITLKHISGSIASGLTFCLISLILMFLSGTSEISRNTLIILIPMLISLIVSLIWRNRTAADVQAIIVAELNEHVEVKRTDNE